MRFQYITDTKTYLPAADEDDPPNTSMSSSSTAVSVNEDELVRQALELTKDDVNELIKEMKELFEAVSVATNPQERKRLMALFNAKDACVLSTLLQSLTLHTLTSSFADD